MSVCESVPLCVIVSCAQTIKVLVSCRKTDCTNIFDVDSKSQSRYKLHDWFQNVHCFTNIISGIVLLLVFTNVDS